MRATEGTRRKRRGNAEPQMLPNVVLRLTADTLMNIRSFRREKKNAGHYCFRCAINADLNCMFCSDAPNRASDPGLYSLFDVEFSSVF